MSSEQMKERNFRPSPINPEDPSYRDVMLQNPQLPIMPKYRFEDFGEFWSCSCGQVNRNEACSNCGLERDLLKKLFPPQADQERPDGSGAAAKEASKETAAGKNGTEGNDPDLREDGPSVGIGAGAAADVKLEAAPADPGEREECDIVPAKRSRRKKRGIASVIIVVCILILGTAFAALHYLVLPQMEQEDALKAKAIDTALTEDIPEVFAPFDDLVYDTYCATGDRMYTDKKYGKAARYYRKANEIRSSAELERKILEAKFSYVRTHKDKEEDREQVADYLEDLVKNNFPGAKELYEEYYVWSASIVVNGDEDDHSKDVKSMQAGETIYFHSTLSGGPPEGSVELSYTITYPDGSADSGEVGSAAGAGETVTTKCVYAQPLSGSGQRLTYKLFTKKNHELLSSDSVSITPAPPKPTVPVVPAPPGRRGFN